MINFHNWLVRKKRFRKIRRERPDVWLFDKTKVGYIQIPKIATRSLKSCFYEYGKSVDDNEKLTDQEIDKKYSHHIKFSELIKLRHNYFLFSFVRDPFSRLYSCYKNKIVRANELQEKNIFHYYGIDFGISFEEFVQRIVQIPDAVSDRHFRSQSSFLTVNNQLVCSYIGKLENIDKDWQYLQSRFQFPSLQHKNRSGACEESIEEIYTAKLAQLVYDRFKNDIELFGYQDSAIKLSVTRS